jgi:gas vesicle protein
MPKRKQRDQEKEALAKPPGAASDKKPSKAVGKGKAGRTKGQKVEEAAPDIRKTSLSEPAQEGPGASEESKASVPLQEEVLPASSGDAAPAAGRAPEAVAARKTSMEEISIDTKPQPTDTTKEDISGTEPIASGPNKSVKQEPKKAMEQVGGVIMMDYKEMIRQAVDFNQKAFETSMNTVVLYQDQGERIWNNLLNQVEGVSESVKKVQMEWVEACRKSREEYQKAVTEGYSKLQEYWTA